MEIEEKHKELLKKLGLRDKDFELFDGKWVKYEYDEEKGVRLYDPYYRTSYNEYIEVNGWSSWSSEEDTFMSDILKPAREEVRRRLELGPRATQGDIDQAIKKKFGKKPETE